MKITKLLSESKSQEHTRTVKKAKMSCT